MKGNTLKTMGYQIEEIPLEARPKALYRHKDGRVVQLPADPRCLRYYLGKGLTLVKDEPSEDKPVEPVRKRKKKAGKSKKGAKG